MLVIIKRAFSLLKYQTNLHSANLPEETTKALRKAKSLQLSQQELCIIIFILVATKTTSFSKQDGPWSLLQVSLFMEQNDVLIGLR